MPDNFTTGENHIIHSAKVKAYLKNKKIFGDNSKFITVYGYDVEYEKEWVELK